MSEKSLILNTIDILDGEKQNILCEILRCHVCLELPEGKQVKVCENGHHFCLSCHKVMKICGVCRGGLINTRNLVVEELVSRLGPILDSSKSLLPPPEPPCVLSQGIFRCSHQCSAKIPAFLMLSHIRARHSSHLIENVRSNPYSGRFSFKYDINFTPNEKFIWSAQVSDMGLFTVVLTFFESDFFGWVRMLAEKIVSSQFRYQLVVKIQKKNSKNLLEFSLTNCSVLSYLDDIKSVRREGNGLEIKGRDLLEYINIGSSMSVFFSVWKNSQTINSEEKSTPSIVCMPERCLFFKNDRKIRRNKNRNMRRKRLKKKLMKDAEVLTS